MENGENSPTSEEDLSLQSQPECSTNHHKPSEINGTQRKLVKHNNSKDDVFVELKYSESDGSWERLRNNDDNASSETECSSSYSVDKTESQFESADSQSGNTEFLETLYACTVCFKKFRHEISVQRHSKTHFNNLLHLCTMCDKVFYTPYALQSHMLVHVQNGFYCEYCAKDCKTVVALETHTRNHISTKVFHCEVCSKGFFSSRNLIIHLQSHKVGIPNKCTFFKRIYPVCVTYNGGQLLNCRLCKEKFDTRWTLVIHERAHRVCPVCENFLMF